MKIINKMKGKLKSLNRLKALLIVLILLIVTISIILIINKIDVDKKTGNLKNTEKISKKLYKEEYLEEFKFSDIKFEYEDQIYTYIAKVTNTNNEPKDFYGVRIYLIQGNKEIGFIEMYNKTVIEPNESIEIKNFSTKDYTKINKFRYELLKETN